MWLRCKYHPICPKGLEHQLWAVGAHGGSCKQLPLGSPSCYSSQNIVGEHCGGVSNFLFCTGSCPCRPQGGLAYALSEWVPPAQAWGDLD